MHARLLFASLLLASFASLASSCGPGPDPPSLHTCEATDSPELVAATSGVPVHTVVFVDRSSTATDTTTGGPYLTALNTAVSRDFATAGSTLDLYLVHDRTTGKAGHESASLIAALPPPTDNDLERKDACDNAHNAFLISKVAGRMKAVRFAQHEQAAEKNRGGSDLWGALQVTSEAAAQDPADRPLRVLFLSDMMQCMPGRCLESKPPASQAQAEAWGREDAARIRNSGLDLDRLARATYTLVSGDFANSTAYTHIPAYWQALLGGLGVPAGNIIVNP